MADSNRNTLKGDHEEEERRPQVAADGAHGEKDREEAADPSADEARNEAEHTYGKTKMHDS
ncbi:MAG: hypothetical protein ABI637_07030 [Gemmatimonadota bacterium]